MPVIPDPPPGAADSATAAAREAAWLQTANDSLPSLLADDGGPWDVIQAYWPGAHFAKDKHGIYVDARPVADPRVSNQRIRPQYTFVLSLTWPVKAQGAAAGTSGKALIAETEQQNLDNAAALLIERIRGPLGDKSHGGRFLSVAENPRTVTYAKEDAAVTIPQHRAVLASITYKADDYEVNG
jgi:hypothetical protein